MAITGEQGNDVVIEVGSKEDPSTCLQQPIDLPLTGERRFPSDLKEELQSLPPWPTECCIYKVPDSLRSINESAYTPMVISIGPLHHGAAKLRPMEVHKRRYSTSEEQDPISIFLLSLHEDFAFEEHDPISKIGPLDDNVLGDLMLLENQLPFFILDRLFCLIFPTAPPNTFLKSAFNYFGDELKIDHFDRFASSDDHQIMHFVDLTLKCNLPYETLQNPTSNNAEIQSPSATTLHNSGIKFKKGGSGCFLDIKLTNAVLEIPFLFVGDFTEERFRNLVAMEQCHQSSTSYITDYIFLMDNLIDTPDDVALLRSRGIISNGLGSDEDVCHLFNNITKGVIFNPRQGSYSRIIEYVNAHYNRRWNLWKAHLKSVYFQNPWTIISLIAALVLLICTLIQTVCGVISVN